MFLQIVRNMSKKRKIELLVRKEQTNSVDFSLDNKLTLLHQISDTRENDFNKLWPVIKKLRCAILAPVDIMGCEQLAEKDGPDGVFEFQILISALLSSQTRDHKTAEAVTRLKERGGKYVGIEWVSERSIEDIADAIRPVGFYNQKAKYMKEIAFILNNKYQSKVPDTFQDLVALPGIGPKMASLILSCGFKKNDSICVDTHVHRISTALKWGCTKCKACKEPEHTRLALQQWLPRALWGEYSLQLVGLGQLMKERKKELLYYCNSCTGEEKDEAVSILQKLGVKF